MSRLFTLLTGLLLAASAHAQITLTAAYFPAAGDTLRYAVADTNLRVDLLSPGANREWDFGTIAAASTFEEVAVSNDGDTLFAEAELRVTLNALAADVLSVSTGYFNVTDTEFELIGARGGIEVFPDYIFTADITPGRADRRAPLMYQDNFSTNTTNSIVISPDSLPPSVVDEYSAVLANVDSIKVTNTSMREDVVDAYGTLLINGRSYSVLRERRTEVLETRIFVKSGLIDFIDLTGALGTLSPEFADFLEVQPPVTTYYYWSNDFKEAIATVQVDADASQRITFRRADQTNSTGGPILTQAQVKVYPNPAPTMATFELDNLDRGTYKIRVINILGRQVAEYKFSPIGNRAKIEVDVSNLPHGPYLYSITNERGRILTTRRLLVGK